MIRNLLFLFAITGLVACGGGVSEETQSFVRTHYGTVLKEFDPLCVYQGPFPWRPSKSFLGCDRCDVLTELGLTVRANDDDAGNAGTGRGFDLTEEGKALYRDDYDADFVEVVEARFAKQGRSVVDPKILNRPRLCFGKARVHKVSAALPRMNIGNEMFQSFKVIIEASDPDPRLFDPRFASLEMGCSQPEKPGQPVLCKERIVTFQIISETHVDLRNDIRYGAWVNEP